tara:strand:- start:13755 stop:14663 length:909 start_codon:yes stop_codon:yes gene_type:complete
MLRETILTLSLTAVLFPTAAMARPAPDFGIDLDRPIIVPGGDEDRDIMIFDQVVSIGVDSFHWYRNDSIGGDTFDIDSMTTNTSAPFQIAVQIEGSWDFTVHSATSIYVYTAGSGSTAVSAGTLTLGDGYHVFYNDTAAGGSELHLDLPGPAPTSAFTSGPSIPILPPSSSASNPLWDEILAEFALVEWGHGEEQLEYRFVGNNAASTLYADLHQPGGTGEIKVSYLGDSSCGSLAMPSERTESYVSVSSGHHYFEAGTSGDGPWSLNVSWGPEFCDEDLNRDGRVDFNDLVIVLSAFGICS